MGNIERKKKPNVEPKPWDYLGWQGEQPTIDDLPRSRTPELEAEVARLRHQLAGAVSLTPEVAATAATLVDLMKRNLPPHISEAQQVEAYLALRRIAGGQ